MSAFANARILSEGWFTTPQGDMVQTNYIDLAGTLPPETPSLAKASEPRFDLRTAASVRLSRPGVFRETGEVLVNDEQEGRARTSTRETIEGPTGATTQRDRRVRAVNAGLRLCHAKLSVSGTMREERTNTATSALTFGKDYLIYCASLWPEAGEENVWRRTFPENYTSVARIHRPTQFAQALGLGVCEHIGATGKPAPVKGALPRIQDVRDAAHAADRAARPCPVRRRPLSLHRRGRGGMGADLFDDLREVPRVRGTEGIPVRHVVDPARGGRGVRPARLGDAEGLPIAGEVSAWRGQRSGDDGAERTGTRRAARDKPGLHLSAK